MNDRIKLFGEQFGESACACLLMMVQGNLLLTSASHWLVATETGIAASAISTVLVLFGRATRPWLISVVLGTVTALADFVVHSHSGLADLGEAVATGVGAMLLSALVTVVAKLVRRHGTRRGMAGTPGSVEQIPGGQS